MAIEASLNSPCQSKRGVVIFEGENHISMGWNNQPAPFVCDGSENCKRSCSKTAIHAEQAAIINALGGGSLVGAEMLHVKTIDGLLVPSMGPSCLQCSKLILAVGLKGMWLFHENGWKWYAAAEFHYRSGTGGDYMTRFSPEKLNTVPQSVGGK